MAKLLEKSLPEPKPRISQQTSNRMISIATISALILTWVIITQNRLVEPLFAPSPTDLWQAFQNLLPNLPGDLVASILRRIVPGFTIGVTVVTLLGIYMAMNQVGRAIFYPIVEILRPLPPLALIPLLILWFGIGYITQILLIAYGIFIIMVINSFEAVRNVPPIYIHAATTLGANRRQIFQRVILPSIVPDIVAGIRVSAAAAFGYDVAAELMGAMTGLGYRLVLARRYLLTQYCRYLDHYCHPFFHHRFSDQTGRCQSYELESARGTKVRHGVGQLLLGVRQGIRLAIYQKLVSKEVQNENHPSPFCSVRARPLHRRLSTSDSTTG